MFRFSCLLIKIIYAAMLSGWGVMRIFFLQKKSENKLLGYNFLYWSFSAIFGFKPVIIQKAFKRLLLYMKVTSFFFLALQIGRAYPMVDHPASIRLSDRASEIFFSLSHLLRDDWSDFFETCLRCSPSGLVVYVQKCYRSVNKYGRRQRSLIFTVIASPPKPLEEFCRNLCISHWSMFTSAGDSV